MAFWKWLKNFFNEQILLIDESAKRDDQARGPYNYEADPLLDLTELGKSHHEAMKTGALPVGMKSVPPAAVELRTVETSIGRFELPEGASSLRVYDSNRRLIEERMPAAQHPRDLGYIGRSPTEIHHTTAPVEAALAAHDAARAAGAPPEVALEAAKVAATKARANAPKTAAKPPVEKTAPKDQKKSKAAPVVKKTTQDAARGKKPAKRS